MNCKSLQFEALCSVHVCAYSIQTALQHIRTVGHNRTHTPYITVFLVIPLPKIRYIHCMYVYIYTVCIYVGIWFWPTLHTLQYYCSNVYRAVGLWIPWQVALGRGSSIRKQWRPQCLLLLVHPFLWKRLWWVVLQASCTTARARSEGREFVKQWSPQCLAFRLSLFVETTLVSGATPCNAFLCEFFMLWESKDQTGDPRCPKAAQGFGPFLSCLLNSDLNFLKGLSSFI